MLINKGDFEAKKVFATNFWYIEAERIPQESDFKRMKEMSDMMQELLSEEVIREQFMEGAEEGEDLKMLCMEAQFDGLYRDFNITRVNHDEKIVAMPDGTPMRLAKWYKTYKGPEEIMLKVRENQKKFGIYKRKWKEMFDLNIVKSHQEAGGNIMMFAPFAKKPIKEKESDSKS